LASRGNSGAVSPAGIDINGNKFWSVRDFKAYRVDNRDTRDMQMIYVGKYI